MVQPGHHMQKRPAQIARSLRAFRNAHRLGLLRYVRIVPGARACDAALAQHGVKYPGNLVPRLPLPRCTAENCLCHYTPVGTEKLRQLSISGKARARDKRDPTKTN
jgi:hypothetical protein